MCISDTPAVNWRQKKTKTDLFFSSTLIQKFWLVIDIVSLSRSLLDSSGFKANYVYLQPMSSLSCIKLAYNQSHRSISPNISPSVSHVGLSIIGLGGVIYSNLPNLSIIDSTLSATEHFSFEVRYHMWGPLGPSVIYEAWAVSYVQSKTVEPLITHISGRPRVWVMYIYEGSWV